MGTWHLEVMKMALYMTFPVGLFYFFNRPEYFEKHVTKRRAKHGAQYKWWRKNLERTTDPQEATGKLSHVPTLAKPDIRTHTDNTFNKLHDRQRREIMPPPNIEAIDIYKAAIEKAQKRKEVKWEEELAKLGEK